MYDDQLFFQMYNPTGMINQVMSLELAVGLAHKTKRRTTIHYLSNDGDSNFDYKKVPIYTPSTFYNDQRKDFTNKEQYPKITDLMDIPELNINFIDEKIERFPEENFVYGNILENNYFSEEDELTFVEMEFAEGRKRLDFKPGINYHLKFTLGWYSRFFYKRDSELDLALSKVSFKQEYQDLALKIAKFLGEFQGAHLRLSDHVRMFNTTEEMFEQGLDKLENNNMKIILCTDEPSHPMVVKNRHRFELLDEIIVNNFRDDFLNLSFNDEVVFGLISNLVMHYSEYFIGTSGSTYTGYIQRKRAQNGFKDWDFFDNPNQNSIGPFSWNNYLLDVHKKMWWREWPESYLRF